MSVSPLTVRVNESSVPPAGVSSNTASGPISSGIENELDDGELDAVTAWELVDTASEYGPVRNARVMSAELSHSSTSGSVMRMAS